MTEERYGIIQNVFTSLFSQIDWDTETLVKHPEFKKGINSLAIAAKAAAKAPFDLDDRAIDQLVMVIDAMIEQKKNIGVIEVGDLPGESTARLKKRHSRQQVEEAIRAEGGDPATFSPFLLVALQFAPMLIELIRKLLGK